MHFDLTDLRLFVHVAEAASITHGATRAHLSLASASARIRGMEEALGLPLLERGRRGVQPSPAGHALAHHARLVLEQLARLQGELGQYAGGLRGHVRLLCNTAAMTEHLPDALGPFLAAHPQIDIDLEERPSYAIVEAIAAGLAEIGILADTVELGALETLPFRADRLVAVVPRAHPLAARRRIGFAEAIEQELVGLSPGSALQDYLAGHAARLGRPLAFRVRLRGFEGVCRMVEAGVGIGIVPEGAARRCRRTMAIAILQLTDSWAERMLTLCVRRAEALPAPARRLLDHLAAGNVADRGPVAGRQRKLKGEQDEYSRRAQTRP